MTEPLMTEIMLLTVCATLLGATGILSWASLSAWRSWLDLKRGGVRQPVADDNPDEQPAVLIELASVRERLRRLEAIANGVEL